MHGDTLSELSDVESLPELLAKYEKSIRGMRRNLLAMERARDLIVRQIDNDKGVCVSTTVIARTVSTRLCECFTATPTVVAG